MVLILPQSMSQYRLTYYGGLKEKCPHSLSLLMEVCLLQFRGCGLAGGSMPLPLGKGFESLRSCLTSCLLDYSSRRELPACCSRHLDCGLLPHCPSHRGFQPPGTVSPPKKYFFFQVALVMLSQKQKSSQCRHFYLVSSLALNSQSSCLSLVGAESPQAGTPLCPSSIRDFALCPEHCNSSGNEIPPLIQSLVKTQTNFYLNSRNF